MPDPYGLRVAVVLVSLIREVDQGPATEEALATLKRDHVALRKLRSLPPRRFTVTCPNEKRMLRRDLDGIAEPRDDSECVRDAAGIDECRSFSAIDAVDCDVDEVGLIRM